jgi:hypothetical protein
MSWILEVMFHASAARVVFANEPDANQALGELRQRLDEDRFASNRRDKNTYTIKGPAQEMCVVLEKVEAASVMSPDQYAALTQRIADAQDDRSIAYEVRRARALQEARTEGAS